MPPISKNVRVPDLALMKERGERIVMLTAYDETIARLFDRAGVDLLLVGDSLGHVIPASDNTIPVSLDAVETKNFHRHLSGPHFRDYHLLLDEQAEQIFEITDDIAERARKIGETTLHSISEIAKYQRLADNSEPFVSPKLMLAELHQDNLQL